MGFIGADELRLAAEGTSSHYYRYLLQILEEST
jgi:hypothetical protein